MSALRLTGSTSGYSEITPPAIAGDQTFTLPGTGGTLTTTNGGQTIEHAAGTASAPSITFTGDVNTGIFSPAADTIAFAEGGVEAARIDSSGRLLVGTSTSETINGDQFKFQVKSTDASAGLVIHRSQTTTSPPYLALAKSRSGAIVSSGDAVGSIVFVGHDGDDLNSLAASIECLVDGTPGANDMPGRLVFSTTKDGASSPVERLRLTNQGVLTVVTDNNTCQINSTTRGAETANAVFIGKHSGTAGTADSGTASIFIYTNGNIQNTNNSYGQISDIKLKENIVDASSQWGDLKAVRVRNFNFKEGQTHRQIGVIAQELGEVSPGLVYETPDRDEDGNETGEVTKGVNYSVLYMKAVKALQEAMERIETLEAQNAAFEDRLAALEAN
jgi:hypothetical protein